MQASLTRRFADVVFMQVICQQTEGAIGLGSLSNIGEKKNLKPNVNDVLGCKKNKYFFFF